MMFSIKNVEVIISYITAAIPFSWGRGYWLMLFSMAHLRYFRGVSSVTWKDQNIKWEHIETIKPYRPWYLIRYNEYTTLSLFFARRGPTEI
jgi:hypothetical protein